MNASLCLNPRKQYPNIAHDLTASFQSIKKLARFSKWLTEEKQLDGRLLYSCLQLLNLVPPFKTKNEAYFEATTQH